MKQHFQIKDPVTITVFNSYDLQNWTKEIIFRCIADNPSFTTQELAEKLNVSDRSLRRYLDNYGLKPGDLGKMKDDILQNGVFKTNSTKSQIHKK